ncbi:ABC transporter substrate-binding protein [Rhodocyclus tenuis]|uniref:ABC transporter substrate-binding protein n=1 Tax=Rhodocyclus gracilis TaxID=2929842 RepID=A0ABX0WLH3_9RHOO|nr:MetQ/NlpA family ABC transporter substrate-binding protein [Rhodocyclus gracilis]MRD73726.1 MetQ/NlpA family lipoprotein [Rhodocyclus gracilis]NJA89798.1 ABC transporter substrate-binding protein [Rhodocyclus gracilis]
MKRQFTPLFAAIFAFAAFSAHADTKLSVAATAVPHAEILEHVKPTLAKEGVTLDIKVFTDYVQPNVQVAEKKIDVNYFQHKPYLDEFNKNKGTHLVSVAAVHVEPYGAYSRKFKKIGDLPAGATIAIPNDPSNAGRALVLLEQNGLIKLKDSHNILSTVKDITENKKEFKFKELEAATLPRVLDQVDLALINTNYALEAKLVPTRDALFIESANSPYANLIVARPDNKDAPAVKKLVSALQSEDVKQFIETKYKGAVVPAF